jgi:hypothetical protein
MSAEQMQIEAVPRRYAGVNFRSTLEADWAATLDDAQILWQYEPTTVTLPSGVTYIPDFYLPEIRTWIEVKGPGVPRIEKALEFAATVACSCQGRGRCVNRECQIVLIGHPPEWALHKWSAHARWSAAVGQQAALARCSACGLHYWHRSNRPACRNCGEVADFYLQADPIEFGHACRVLSDLSGGPLADEHAAIVDGLGDVERKLFGMPKRRTPPGSSHSESAPAELRLR